MIPLQGVTSGFRFEAPGRMRFTVSSRMARWSECGIRGQNSRVRCIKFISGVAVYFTSAITLSIAFWPVTASVRPDKLRAAGLQSVALRHWLRGGGLLLRPSGEASGAVRMLGVGCILPRQISRSWRSALIRPDAMHAWFVNFLTRIDDFNVPRTGWP